MPDLEASIRAIVRDEVDRALRAKANNENSAAGAEIRVEAVPPHQLYSVIEAARVLGVSKHFVYSRIQSGEILTLNLGDGREKTRISAAALSEYIRGRVSSR